MVPVVNLKLQTSTQQNQPYVCKDHLRQAGLEENVFDLSPVNEAIAVSVGPRKHVIILCLLCRRHNPLGSRHLTIK